MDMSDIVTASLDAERRRLGVESALGSLRIEGLEIDDETWAIFDRYIVGEIEIDELMPRLLALR